MNNRCRKRRGFAMIVAVSLLALVAVAATLVAQLAVGDVRRTGDERRATQDRLTLLAGLRIAEARLAAGEALAAGPVPTPADAPLTFESVGAAAADRTLVTMLAGATRQRATFARAADGAWSLERAEIVR